MDIYVETVPVWAALNMGPGAVKRVAAEWQGRAYSEFAVQAGAPDRRVQLGPEWIYTHERLMVSSGGLHCDLNLRVRGDTILEVTGPTC